MRHAHSSRKGSVLIFAIWLTLFLSIFAVQIGLRVRQRAHFLSRLETRSQLSLMAESGIKKGISLIRADHKRSPGRFTPYSKYFRHNNPLHFRNIMTNAGEVNVSYTYVDQSLNGPRTNYGVVDEESKLNINTIDGTSLRNLFEIVLGQASSEAQDLADAIIDWREMGTVLPSGFYSDDYYGSLKHPYEPKNSSFETLDEILLLSPINRRIYDTVLRYVTIYGDGQININTASREVLLALGLDDKLVEKIISVRRGTDGLEFTTDDYIFDKTFDIASEIKNFVELTPREINQIDSLNNARRIKTTSNYYMIRSQALIRSKYHHEALCVFNLKDNSIEYYREKTEDFIEYN